MSRFSYKTLILILLFLLIPIVLFFRLSQRGKQVSAEWFNDSWNYRQRVDISNSSGSDLTDFQVSIDIGTSALIAAGKMQSDCDDIRITDQNGNLLPFWIEENNPGCNQVTDTKIWVKASSIPTSGAPVYFYYGNSQATSAQNGNDVFEFFDDFNSVSLDANKWENWTVDSYIPSHTIAGGAVQLTGTGNSGLKTKTYSGSNYKVISRTQNNTDSGLLLRVTDNTHLYLMRTNASGNATDYYMRNGSWFSLGGSYPNFGNWTNWRIIEFSANGSSLSSKVDGTELTTLTNATFSSGGIGLRRFSSNPSFDWIIVTKFSSSDPTATPASEEVGGGPIAYWKFDEGVGTTAYDSTSNNTHGTFGIGGSAPTWVTEDQCISGKCLSFDGTNDRIIISKSIPIAPNPGFTITHWIKTSASGNGVYTIGNAGGSSGYRFGITQGKVSFLIGNGTYDETTCGNVLVNDNKWHQITGIYTTTTFKCFVDGEIDNTINISDRTGMPTTAPRIGDPPCCTDFSGLLDEVKIFPYARTADQIKADYASGLAGMSSSSDSSVNIGGASSGKALSDGLVGYWKMDETSSPSLDYSGRGYSATWNGDAASGAGKFGNGITQADGGGGNLSVSDTGNPHDMGTGNFSIAMWFKLDSLDSPDAPELFDKMTGAVTGYHLRVAYSNEVELMVKGTNGTVEANSINNAIQTGNWYHVTAVYDKTNGHKIYLNGTQSGSTVTGDAGNIDNDDPLRIGMGFNGWEMDGTYDEVRLYNRALNPTEVKQLYEYAPGPLTYWNFENSIGNTLPDISSHNYNGTLNGTYSFLPGKIGKSIDLDGSTSYISASNIPKYMYDYTYSFWAKIEGDGAAGYNPLIYGTNGGNLNRLMVSNSNKRILFQFTGSSDYSTYFDKVLSYNTWYYFSFVKSISTGQYKLYIDGIDSGSKSIVESDGSTGSFYLGYGGSERFNGKFDDFKIYNYARTQKQILEDMAGSPPPGSTAKVSTPLVYYKFDEGFGSTVNNSGNSGAALNGNITGATWTTGKSNKGLNFNGNHFVKLTTPALANQAALSVTVWAKPSSLGNHATIIGEYSPGVIFGLMSNGTFKFYNGSNYYSTANPVKANQWQHLSYVFDGSTGTIKFYHNGQFAEQITGVGTKLVNSTTNTEIGSRSDGSNDRYLGILDDLKIYNYALSADEVKQDYNQGSSFVFGTSNQTIGATTTSLDYCIPGDTTYCSPPIGEWKFDEGLGTTAYDTSGNNNDGTLINSPTWTTGKIGKGLGFNGTNTYSRINRIINDSFTISVWFNTTDTGSGGTDYRWYKGDGLVDSETVGVVNDFGISHHSNGYIIAGVGNPDVHVISNPGLNDGKWHFAEFTRDINTGIVKLYIDGSLVDTNTGNTSSLNSTLYTDIGRIQTGVNYFSGKLDQIRIYDYARTPAQIAYDYNQGAPVGHWKLDECQGTAIHDSSGNNNHGTLSIGASGTQTTPGTCPATAGAWYNGKLGKLNASLNFDGSDDYVPVTGFKPQVSNGFTASAWFKTNSSGVRRFVINQWGSGGAGNASWGIEMNTSNQIVFETYSGASAYLYTTSNTYNNSSWNHAVITYNGTSMKSYINGTLLDTRNATVQNSTNYDLHIGQEASGGEYWLGQIDDVRIYNYALTATQVKTLYNNGSVNFR